MGAVMGALLTSAVAGCSCNTTNAFDDQYCNTYADITLLPAFLIGVAFFALLLLAIVAFQRLTRRAPSERSGLPALRGPSFEPPWRVQGLEARAPSLVLDELADLGVGIRVLERFDGTWLVEVRVPNAHPPFDYMSSWGPLETVSRDALRAMRDRGLVEDDGGA